MSMNYRIINIHCLFIIKREQKNFFLILFTVIIMMSRINVIIFSASSFLLFSLLVLSDSVFSDACEHPRFPFTFLFCLCACDYLPSLKLFIIIIFFSFFFVSLGNMPPLLVCLCVHWERKAREHKREREGKNMKEMTSLFFFLRVSSTPSAAQINYMAFFICQCLNISQRKQSHEKTKRKLIDLKKHLKK